MDWKPKSATPCIIDDIFDPAKGWSFSARDVPLERRVGPDGNPSYVVTVDGIPLTVFEQTHWTEGVIRTAPANRLVVLTRFTNVVIKNPVVLLKGSYGTRGYPSFGVDETGAICLHAAFPIGSGFPVDLARRQLMVCMGIVAEEAAENLRIWNSGPSTAGSSWATAGKVATVAGIFLNALFDL